MRRPVDPRVYWATLPSGEEFVSAFAERLRRYRASLEVSGRLRRMRRAWRCAYGWSPSGAGDASELRESGEQGELIEVTTNEFMGLVSQTLSLLLNERPAVSPVADNSDYKSLAQTRLASGLLDYYDRRLNLQERDSEAALLALLLSEAWQVWGWDTAAGEVELETPDGPILQGDAYVRTVSPLECCYDSSTQTADGMQWFAYRIRVNRHDLSAQHPELAEQLAESRGLEAHEEVSDWRHEPGQLEDTVWLWEVRVLPSPACPPGRLVQLVDADCVVYDSARPDEQGRTGGYPYGTSLHCYQLKPDVVPGQVGGNTHHWDLLSLQEALDNCVTQMASAANVGGIQNLWTPLGQLPVVSQMGGGLNFIESTQPPQPIDGPRVDPQAVALAHYVVELMRRRIGLNDVAVGESSKGMPAQLAALMQAQAVQYHNRLQASYVRLVEQGRGGLLSILRNFADSRRVALISGKGNTWALREWTGQDIGDIERVSVEPVPAALKTTAGKMQLAQMMLDRQLVTSAKEALLLITTGRLEPLYEADETNLLRLQREKELLRQGIGLPPVDEAASALAGTPVFVPTRGRIQPLKTDTHWLDIPEYLSVLSSPESRESPEVTEAVLSLVEYKLQLWRQTDPLLQLLRGCPPQLVQAQTPVPPMPIASSSPTPGTRPPGPGAQPVQGLPVDGPEVSRPELPSPPPDPLAQDGGQ